MTLTDHETAPQCDALLLTEANAEPISPLDRCQHRQGTSRRHGPALSEPSIASRCPNLADLDADQLKRLESWSQFWIMAIKIDSEMAVTEYDQLQGLINDILRRSEKPDDAIQTRWKDDICLYAMTGYEKDAVKAMARNLQSNLARQRVESLSIGLSQFPLKKYSHSDCALNACKALDHAAFFGSGAITIFDAVSCNISGDKFYQNGELDHAMAEYQAGLVLDPSNANLLNSLGVCLAKRDELPKAKAAFETSLQHDPDEAFALYNLAMIHILNHEPQAALNHLEKAIALNKNTFEIPFQIGKILCDLSRHENAIAYFEAAGKVCPNKSTVFRFKGQCLAATGNPAEAIASYRHAVKLNPNDATTLSALGSLYAAIDENPEICVAFFKQSIAIEPDNGLFQHRLGEFYQEQNQLQLALQAFEKAIDLGHDSSPQISELQHLASESMQDPKCCSV